MLTEDQILHFQHKGVLYLPGVFKQWVPALQQAVEQALSQPSALERSYKPQDGSAPFFQDYCNWQRFSTLYDFVFHSPAAKVAAQLMKSQTVRFFHDHILVKHPGTSLITPWHQDQPYYCVQGEQSVSFWTPLDPVDQKRSLECVAGSHLWSQVGFRPKRFDGTNLYKKDEFAELPDIDANRESFEILSYEMQPGDAIAFDFRTIHGAAGNHSKTSRRVVSTRWVGDDARWAVRQGVTSPPFPHIDLPDGAPFDAPEFPLIQIH